MNGDVEAEAPRPRPLSAGIWTLFSWLRRTDRSSSSESVSSVGSDRTVASFDFLAPLHYQRANAPLVLPQGPLTDTYKNRLHERNLRRLHDRDLTLRRKYGLFREEGLGYDAFSLPSSRRLQKDTVLRQDRDRRATSEIQRRSAYVPGKRRAPLPPTVVTSTTLPRNYKRKRPAPKPPVTISEENKENVEINQILQMNPASDVSEHSQLSKDLASANKTEKQNTKEVKLRTDKGFLKQIFDGKKRNSAVDTSRVKLLPSISELDKQAAEIIEANKALRASGHSDSNFSSEDTWMCTTCLRKYKPVVTCCIYCMIKESSNCSKDVIVPTHVSNIYTQTDENTLKSYKNSGNDDKKKLREMLKEMKDSLPKRPKHDDKHQEENGNRIIKPTETPTLRIGSTIDENIKGSYKNTKCFEKEQGPDALKNSAKEILVTFQPSASRDIPIEIITNNVADTIRQPTLKSSSLNSNIAGDSIKKASTIKALEVSIEEANVSSNKKITENNLENHLGNNVKQTENILKDDVKETNKIHPNLEDTNECKSLTRRNVSNNAQSNENKSDQLLKEHKDISTKDPPSIISTNNYKETALTENPASVKIPSMSANNNNQSIKKCVSACSGAKDKIERIELGNVFSSNIVNINQTNLAISSNSEKNNLHKPLKISSLLNPLYCPKYTSNDKVSDCNFAKVLPTKPANVANNKIDVTPIDQQTVIPKVTVSPSVNSKRLTEALQKSEARPTDNLKVKSREIVSASVEENLKRKIDDNLSSEVKSTPTPAVKIFDHHDRRRNLINQLEQAISKGDEQLAAEAAAKLAKLKLACSVLSFSSQIVAEPIPNKEEAIQDNTKSKENQTQEHINSEKVESKVQEHKALIDKNQQENQPKLKSATHNAVNISSGATATTSSQILTTEDEIPIKVWVEDKVAVRGPIPLRISRKAKLRELKVHVETSLGLEIRFQRWIVGRTLCTDDTAPLVVLAGPELNAPFFLCLVESETNKDNSPHINNDERQTQNKTQPNEINNAAAGDVYTELMKLEQQALVPNTEEFECGVCIERCAAGAGAVLRECIHTFCRECLADVIRHCEEPVVACPAIQCPGALQEREIRAILSPEEYERWLARGLAAAESGTRNTFHCRTRDCNGWAFCEPGVRRFPCPVCKHTNCVPCQAVHEGESCEQYQVKLREAVSAAESNQTDEGTQALLKSLISRGEALECPECKAVITKKWGCDWVKCSACKTEICWVTRGRRWGPGGKGDTSGGCKCGVDGKRCHPSCGYCH